MIRWVGGGEGLVGRSGGWRGGASWTIRWVEGRG